MLVQCHCARRAALSARAFTPGSREHALAALQVEEGGFGDVACGERDGVRGLYATKDVPKGTLLLSVPEACCIAADEGPASGASAARAHDGAPRRVAEPRRAKVYTDVLPEAPAAVD